jgi:hypothetical protein
MADQFDILDRPEILQVLFHPRRDPAGRRPEDNIYDVDFPMEDGVTVGGRLFVASPDAPVILYFHGNGELASDYDMLAPLYTAKGITLLVADYRGYGRSGGTPTAAALIGDGRAIFEQTPEILKRHGLNPPRLYLMGRSLGSASAIDIAEKVGDRIAGLIIESGFAHTFALITRLSTIEYPSDHEAAHGFGNARKIERVTVPTLIIHGTYDWIIPIGDGDALLDHCGAAEKRLVPIVGAGHNDLLFVGQKPYMESVATFVLQNRLPGSITP